MPQRPRKPCNVYGCGILTRERYCPTHKDERQQGQQVYKTTRWRQLRQAVLRDSPLCVHCEDQGIVTPATEVDHIKPHMGIAGRIYDRDNLQGLCHECHSRKTVTIDGGFG